MTNTALSVSSLTIYPVKSLRGMSVTEAQVGPRGFRGDRRLMVTTPEGRFLTQRECRAMALVAARLDGDLLVLRAPGRADLAISADHRDEGLEVAVWDSRVEALRVGADVDRWLSDALERPVQLVAMPESSRRSVDPAFNRGADIVSFADGYPYLIVGDSSLDDLNRRLAVPVPMTRFRPNITVSGSEPFAEDRWASFRIAQTAFAGAKLCGRCVVTTIDPESARAAREPLATMSGYRTVGGHAVFGLYAMSDGSGVVRVGDPVEIVSEQAIPGDSGSAGE